MRKQSFAKDDMRRGFALTLHDADRDGHGDPGRRSNIGSVSFSAGLFQNLAHRLEQVIVVEGLGERTSCAQCAGYG